MPRKRRSSWSKITFTLSDEVQTALRVQAAREGLEIGILADRILRATLARVIEQERGMQQEILARPLPLTISSNAIQRSDTPKAPPSTAPTDIECSDDTFRDRTQRADLEVRFLNEVLAHAHHGTGWESFVDQLQQTEVFARMSGEPLSQADNMEDEINGWVLAKRIPSRWKPHVFSALDGGNLFFPSIFNGTGLSPDDFFDWEQP